MPEKKRGFHALEKRIHEIEEEDRAAELRTGEPEKGGKEREAPAGKRDEPRK